MQHAPAAQIRQHGDFLGALAPVDALARGRATDIVIQPYVFAQREAPQVEPGPEAERVFWFPLARAISGELDDRYEYRGREGVFRLPCWRFDGEVIWGLTHRMISQLLGLPRST